MLNAQFKISSSVMLGVVPRVCNDFVWTIGVANTEETARDKVATSWKAFMVAWGLNG